MGELTEALALYERALSIDGNQPEALMALITTKLKVCDWTNYVDYFDVLYKTVKAQVE